MLWLAAGLAVFGLCLSWLGLFALRGRVGAAAMYLSLAMCLSALLIVGLDA